MTIQQFWKLIDTAAKKAKSDSEQFMELISESLSELTPEDLIAFKQFQNEEMDRAYTWDLWGAAYIINGGASDDGFEYFRAWLMSRGSEAWEAALKDADSLASLKNVPQDECELEEFLYASVDAYEQQTGDNLYDKLPTGKETPNHPAGERWDEDGDDLAERFPKLWKKFGA
jgi:hypothetical protein